MKGFQNRKGEDLQKPFPSCVGRMINIFDMSTGIPRNKLIAEKPHRDVSQNYRSKEDVVKKKAMDSFGVQKEEKTIRIKLKKNLSKKTGGTPIKMLIAQEMSKELHSKQKPSGVVARLMGLDTLPVQQSAGSATQGSTENVRDEFSGALPQGDSSMNATTRFSTKCNVHDNEYEDAHEIGQQPSVNILFRDKPQQNGSHSEHTLEGRVALVRQKITEAKGLATDELLIRSKQFQEAVKVLNSNRDLFLKFLEGPDAPFSKYIAEVQTGLHALQTRRITILKPSKIVEQKDKAQERRVVHAAVEGAQQHVDMSLRGSGCPNFDLLEAESISHPTRIVVLKPSLGMPPESKAGSAPPMIPSNMLKARDCSSCLEPSEEIESIAAAREITRQMKEYADSNQNEEISVPSDLSNGYVGDESSFNRSEYDYSKEECGNASDSASVTLTSRHPWDYSFRLSSLHSISSVSQASDSSEPSVVKEAKKRLSERWAMLASKETNQEQSRVLRNTSTLGEMLSIPILKKEEATDHLTLSSRRSYSGDRGQWAFSSCWSMNGVKEGCSQDSPGNFGRSKSLPASSSVYQNIGLMINKSIFPKEVGAKPKSGMSSLKGKVSSLFLSRIKKAVKEKPTSSHCLGWDHSESFHKEGAPSTQSFDHWHAEDGVLVSCVERMTKASSSISLKGSRKGGSTSKASCSFEKSKVCESLNENQDQPIPISVLEAPFEEDPNIIISQASSSVLSCHPQALSRSPPIGSISRTLSWDNPREMPLPNTLKPCRVLSRECKEQELYLLFQKLLSCANLLDDTESTNVLAKWHSLDSPLDLLLLDEFLDQKEEGAKSRERRSNQRLLFDCVNAALSSLGQASLLSSYPWTMAYGWVTKNWRTSTPPTEDVWRLVKDWFSYHEMQLPGETDNQNTVSEKLVKGEIAGKGWAESMCMEVDEFSREIGAKVLEELVEEALADLTDACF